MRAPLLWPLALLLTSGVGAQTRVPEEAPRDVRRVGPLLAQAPRLVLASGDLRVTLALPDPDRGFYRGTRFDWAGMITDVSLKGRRFYGPWFDAVAPNIRDYVDDGRTLVAGPQTSATGPAEEFVGQQADPVPGFAAAAVGGSFVKIGVGRLERPDAEPYNRFRLYRIVDGGERTTSRTHDSVTFRQRLSPDAGGYGYDYRKTVRVLPGGVMVLEHRLRNIGAKRIATQVYNHNFARFDGREVEPGTTVRFPYPPAGPVSAPALATLDGAVLRYLRPLGAGDHVQMPADALPAGQPTGPFVVEIPDGPSIRMEADVPLTRAMLWSIRRTIAVEPFITIDLAPGEEKAWAWRYTYSAGRR